VRPQNISVAESDDRLNELAARAAREGAVFCEFGMGKLRRTPKTECSVFTHALSAALPNIVRHVISTFGLFYFQWAIQGSNL
jgi:hypothetical protein